MRRDAGRTPGAQFRVAGSPVTIRGRISALRRILDRYILREVVLELARRHGRAARHSAHQPARARARARRRKPVSAVASSSSSSGSARCRISACSCPSGCCSAWCSPSAGSITTARWLRRSPAASGRPRSTCRCRDPDGARHRVLAWLTLYRRAGCHRPHARRCAVRHCRQGSSRRSRPGRFRTFGGSDAVVYAEGVGRGWHAHECVRRARSRGGAWKWRWPSAREHAVGRRRHDAHHHALRRRALRGHAGQPALPHHALRGEHHSGARCRSSRTPSTSSRPMPTRALLGSRDREKRAELHWRIAMPVMCLVLTLLAVPLSRLRPREGRYARVGSRCSSTSSTRRSLSAGEGVDRARHGAGMRSGCGGCTSGGDRARAAVICGPALASRGCATGPEAVPA